MRKKSAVIVAVLAILFSLGAVIFASFRPIMILRQGSARLLQPVMRIADTVGRAIGFQARAPFSPALGTGEEDRIARNIAEVRLAQTTDENISLKKILALKQQFGPSLTPAGVMLYHQEWDRERLIIDVGEDRGVRRGDIVIDENQFLVGEVAEVGSGSAAVAIASNKGIAFSIALASSGKEALAQGIGARAFRLELIPRDAEVNLGDLAVRISKSDKRIPSIFAGRIVRLDSGTGDAFKEGSAVLLSHPDQLDRVLIITAL